MADDLDSLDDDLLKELGLDPDELSKPLVRPTSAAQSTVGAPTGGTNPRMAQPSQANTPVRKSIPTPPTSNAPAGPLQQARRPVTQETSSSAAPTPSQAPVPQRPTAQPSSVAPDPSVQFSDNLKNLAEDMPLQIVAVLGKKTMTLKEVVALKQGEVIDLKKMPHDTIDLVANGKLVARGELVLIDGKVGIQIKQLIGN